MICPWCFTVVTGVTPGGTKWAKNYDWRIGMRVSVSESHCQGHTMCNMVAPDIYKLDDVDGHAYVDDPNIPDALAEKARAGQSACPERAIMVEE
jgi:ferredoxin